MVLILCRTLFAVLSLAAVTLGTDTRSVSFFDVLLNILAYTNDFANKLVTHDYRVRCLTPAAGQSMDVAATYTTMRNFDLRRSVHLPHPVVLAIYLNVSFFPFLWLKFFPFHAAFRAILIVGNPACEFT